MDEQAPQLISNLITEVGLPVALLLGSVGVIYFLIRYVLGQIVSTISKSQEETKDEIQKLYEINVQLIKRIHRMENSVIRTNAEWRTAHGLKIHENHIGQIESEDDA
jgi:hypothetical protein